MEPTEEDSLLGKLLSGMNSNYQTTMTVSSPVATLYKEALEQVIAPPLTTIHADLTESDFHYDEVVSTLVATISAFSKLYDYNKGEYTEITLRNPKTGNIANFKWFQEHKHMNDDLCYHLYGGSWNNTRLWLKVYKTSVQSRAV